MNVIEHVAAAPVARSAGRPRLESRLEVGWARSEEDVRAAQRLRWQVFVDEMGARIAPPPGTPAWHDSDLFDPFCEHLLLRDWPGDGSEPDVVGTYRVLTPEAARRVGAYYTDTEFDLVRLRSLRPRMAEFGRACVAPAHRQGAALLMMWGALAAFVHGHGLDCVIGCTSVPMRDGGHFAASLWRQLQGEHLAPIEHHVRPRHALPVDELRCDLPAEPPTLLKAYLRCGAKLLGPPAWDPDFQCADLPLLLRLADLPTAYRRRLLPAR